MNQSSSAAKPNARQSIRVFLVDDSVLVRRGIKDVLSSSSKVEISVVGECGLALQAAEACLAAKADVILLDIRLPDGSGLEVCKQILSAQPTAKVLMLTSYSNDNYVYEAITSGAQGYLMKDIDPVGLIQAVVDVHQGRSILDPEATARVMRMVRSQSTQGGAQELSALSAQERRVLALVAAGKTNKEIAVDLKLSDNTVKNYLGSVFEKLQVKRRSQAAAIYVHVNSGAA